MTYRKINHFFSRIYKKYSDKGSGRSDALNDQKKIPGNKAVNNEKNSDTSQTKTDEGGRTNVHTSSGNKGADSKAGNAKLEVNRPKGKSNVKVEYVEKE